MGTSFVVFFYIVLVVWHYVGCCAKFYHYTCEYVRGMLQPKGSFKTLGHFMHGWVAKWPLRLYLHHFLVPHSRSSFLAWLEMLLCFND